MMGLRTYPLRDLNQNDRFGILIENGVIQTYLILQIEDSQVVTRREGDGKTGMFDRFIEVFKLN